MGLRTVVKPGVRIVFLLLGNNREIELITPPKRFAWVFLYKFEKLLYVFGS